MAGSPFLGLTIKKESLCLDSLVPRLTMTANTFRYLRQRLPSEIHLSKELGYCLHLQIPALYFLWSLQKTYMFDKPTRISTMRLTSDSIAQQMTIPRSTLLSLEHQALENQPFSYTSPSDFLLQAVTTTHLL